MQEAKKSCRSLSDHDCVLRRLDPLLCDRLLGLGPPAEDGPPADEAQEVPETPQGHGQDTSIDCDARSMLIAKWEEPGARPQPSPPPPEAPLEGVLRRLQATEVARSLTEHTCRDAGEVLRPGCWTAAPRHLFCEALE